MKNGLIVDKHGNKCWYKNNKLHRDDGPAFENTDGVKAWYKDDLLHRENGPAVDDDNGYKEWHVNGWLHRENGPAVEWADGSKQWWINGKLHREDGPAIEYTNGTRAWYIHGEQYTKKEFVNILQPKNNMKTSEVLQHARHRVEKYPAKYSIIGAIRSVVGYEEDIEDDLDVNALAIINAFADYAEDLNYDTTLAIMDRLIELAKDKGI